MAVHPIARVDGLARVWSARRNANVLHFFCMYKDRLGGWQELHTVPAEFVVRFLRTLSTDMLLAIVQLVGEEIQQPFIGSDLPEHQFFLVPPPHSYQYTRRPQDPRAPGDYTELERYIVGKPREHFEQFVEKEFIDKEISEDMKVLQKSFGHMLPL